MDLVTKDSARVQAKLESVPEEQRLILSRRCSTDDEKPKAGPAVNVTQSVIAGFVHGVIVMMSFGSFAIVIFGQSEHKELREALAIGISQQVLSASVLIGLMTIRGFFPFTMGGPTPPAALLVADVVRSVVDQVEDPDKKVPTALLTIALVSILMGVMLVLISATKTTVYALQLPYPVLCGFLGSVGVLLMRNAISILINLKLKWVFIPADFDKAAELDPVGVVLQLALGIAVAGLLLQVVPRVRAKVNAKVGMWVLPVMFVLPVIFFYVGVLAVGQDVGIDSELRALNPPWLSKSSEWTWAPKDFFSNMYDVSRWDLGAVFGAVSILRMLISSFLCVIAALINMAGIETNAPQAKSLDLDKEFMTLGCANLVVGVLGGHPGHHVAAFTLPMKKDGGTSRIAPYTAVALWFAAFLSAAPMGAMIPRFFFGGCFLQVGFGLTRTFLYDNRKGMDWGSLVIAIMTVIVAVFTDLNVACGVGFVLVAANFVRLSMNQNVVRAVERADMKGAPTYRTQKELEVLKIHGHKVMVLYLEGYLFWGTVDEITGAFEELIDGTDDDPETIFVDLRYVTGIELSVITTFKKLHRLAGSVDIKIKLCSLPSEDTIGAGLRGLLMGLPFACKDDLCAEIEKCEDGILASYVDAYSPKKNYENLDLEAGEGDELVAAVSSWAIQEQAYTHITPQKARTLRKLMQNTGSAYGIRWECMNGELVLAQANYAPWRAQKLVERAIENSEPVSAYVTKSMGYVFTVNAKAKEDSLKGLRRPRAMDWLGDAAQQPEMVPETMEQDTKAAVALDDQANQPSSARSGKGNKVNAKETTDEHPVCRHSFRNDTQTQVQDVIARSFLLQKAILCEDVMLLNDSIFQRKAIAQEFNIKKVIFLPTTDGVYELGNIGESDEAHKASEPSVAHPMPIVLPEDPAVLVEPDKTDSLREAFRVKKWMWTEGDSEAPEPTLAGGIGKTLSWNLVLALGSVGHFTKLAKDDELVSPAVTMTSSKGLEVADELFIVLSGVFGTFSRVQVGEEETTYQMVIKSPAGTMIGAEDVWACTPRTVQIRCLTDEGQVVALSRTAVKMIELCRSAFVTQKEAEEFIDFMKREMSLNMSIQARSFHNPGF